MSELEDRLRRVLTDPSWALPVPQDPAEWAKRRARRRPWRPFVAAIAAVGVALGAGVAVPAVLQAAGEDRSLVVEQSRDGLTLRVELSADHAVVGRRVTGVLVVRNDRPEPVRLLESCLAPLRLFADYTPAVAPAAPPGDGPVAEYHQLVLGLATRAAARPGPKSIAVGGGFRIVREQRPCARGQEDRSVELPSGGTATVEVDWLPRSPGGARIDTDLPLHANVTYLLPDGPDGPVQGDTHSAGSTTPNARVLDARFTIPLSGGDPERAKLPDVVDSALGDARFRRVVESIPSEQWTYAWALPFDKPARDGRGVFTAGEADTDRILQPADTWHVVLDYGDDTGREHRLTALVDGRTGSVRDVAHTADDDPSQSSEQAQRDGVPAAVAALPFADRVRVVAQEEADDGIWAVSRVPGGPQLLGDAGGRYGIDWVNSLEYGELLHLDRTGTRILRAVPLPGVPPQSLRVHDDAVYCSRQGDGALPHSMLCRVDREGPGSLVRVYAPEGPDGAEPRLLPGWQVQPAPAEAVFSEVVVCLQGVCAQGGPPAEPDAVPFHPATLVLPYDRAEAADTQQACRHVQAAVVVQQGVTSATDPDWQRVEASLVDAWRAGRDGSDPLFVRNLVAPGSFLAGDTQSRGDAVDRLAGLCGLRPTGLRAPTAQRLDRTDEFGAVTGTTRLADGTLRVQVDRVDWLSGDEAQAAAAADGTDAGDYYVVDDNPRTRTYDVSPGAKVYGSIRLTGVPDLSPRTLADWTRFLSSGSLAMRGQDVAAQVRGTYFHFQVEDGLVVGIEEQYRP